MASNIVMEVADEQTDGSGGYSDEEQADPEEYQRFDEEVREDRQLMQYRKAHDDWCSCGGKCWPPGFAESSLDLKCCQEIPRPLT